MNSLARWRSPRSRAPRRDLVDRVGERLGCTLKYTVHGASETFRRGIGSPLRAAGEIAPGVRARARLHAVQRGADQGRSDAHLGADLAKRIITEVEVSLLTRAALWKRDRVLLETLHAGGLRVSEVVALMWADVLPPGEPRCSCR
jgi:hypothetical protein